MADTVRAEGAIRVCPLCQLEATRVPALDTETEIAFQCQGPHPAFREAYQPPPPPPSTAKVKRVAVSETTPVSDATETK